MTDHAPRRVLVTGSASGLGKALTERFAAQGDLVLATDVAPAAPVPEGATYRRLDVTSELHWQAARDWVVQQWGGLDVLVNNAGIAAGGRIEVVPATVWQRVLEVNLMGVVNGCIAFAPLFQEAGSGHIVNVASMAGLVHAPGMGAYNASKAGVVALSETLRFELEPYGVVTSVVCPTYFRTNLAASMPGADPMFEKIAERLISSSPRSADDVADVVMRGIERRSAVIITDRPGRVAFWTKRLARPLYDRQQFDFARRIVAKSGRVLRSPQV
jgi:NAD(P)-dependent dehydrogenase (short-subunit alcohol dehydrogenase family)